METCTFKQPGQIVWPLSPASWKLWAWMIDSDWTACLTLVWQLEWTNQYNYIGQNKKSDSWLATHHLMKTQDHSSGNYCATLFNLVKQQIKLNKYLIAIRENRILLSTGGGAICRHYAYFIHKCLFGVTNCNCSA